MYGWVVIDDVWARVRKAGRGVERRMGRSSDTPQQGSHVVDARLSVCSSTGYAQAGVGAWERCGETGYGIRVSRSI